MCSRDANLVVIIFRTTSILVQFAGKGIAEVEYKAESEPESDSIRRVVEEEGVVRIGRLALC